MKQRISRVALKTKRDLPEPPGSWIRVPLVLVGVDELLRVGGGHGDGGRGHDDESQHAAFLNRI